MKWTIIYTLMMASMFMSGFVANAEMPAAVPPQKDKGAIASGENEILTAIGVVDLMQRGSSDADIAKLLSDQRGYDRVSALKRGNSDEQIIKYLMAITTKNIIDDNKSLQHKMEGDKYYREPQYDKAAKEYTLAIKYSDDKYEPYKLRADTYKQYLKTKLNPVGSDSNKTRQGLVDKSRTLMCYAIYADYTKATKINDKTLSDIILEFNVLKNRMASEKMDYDTDINVLPYYYKSAQKVYSMRRFRGIRQSRVTASIADADIKKALSDYKLVCGKEDAARGELIRIEKDERRDKKWIKYGETTETSHFYDKSGVAKSKESLTVWTRQERSDEKSYDVTRVRINCGSSTIGKIEFSRYDEMGNLVSNRHYDDVTMANITPNSVDGLLFKEVCQ
jgi:hypothetical protein